MFLFVLTLHFLLCAVLVGLVLIQQGKGADMGAAFGSGGSNSLFGAGGATSLIVKITTAAAIAFMITSITLINLSGSESGLASFSGKTGEKPSLAGSVMEKVAPAIPTSATAEEAKPVTAEAATNVAEGTQEVAVQPAVAAQPAEAAQAVATVVGKEEKK